MLIEANEHPLDKNMINRVNHVITRARGVSRRAGFGWLLLNADGTFLCDRAYQSGTHKTALEKDIADHRSALKTLIISSDLAAGICDVRGVTREVEKSNCDFIAIAHRLPKNISDGYWKRWVTEWPGTVQYAPHTTIAEKLCAGLIKMGDEGRPWVTAVSASTMENLNTALIDLKDEFGFLSHIRGLVNESRSIFYNPTQKEILTLLPQSSKTGADHNLYELNDIDNMWDALESCFLEKRYSAILFGVPNQISTYAQEKLIDEVCHHIVITPKKSSHNIPTSPEFLKLKDWTITSSEVIGNCTRITILSNENLSTRPQDSGDGSN